MIRVTLCALAAFAAFAGATSLLGLEALGQSRDGFSSRSEGRGYAGGAKTGDGLNLWNPAVLAFEDKVSLSLGLEYSLVSAKSNGSSFTTSNVDIPSMTLSFPMGAFGAAGVGLVQQFTSDLTAEVKDSSDAELAKIEYQGSVFELTPTYAVRLPFLRRVSLGATAHFVLGANSRKLTLGADNGAVADDDAWATNSSNVIDKVNGSWKIKDHPAYYTGAVEYHSRNLGYYLSYTMKHTLRNTLDYNFEFSQTDTLVPTHTHRDIEIPQMFATGVNYQFMDRNNIMLDFMLRGWDKDVPNLAGSWNIADTTETQTEMMAAIGYQRDGGKGMFDNFWQRNTYRIGAWFRNWYICDVTEFGGALGVGIPLGKRGTQIDVSLSGGTRKVDSDSGWDEKFFGLTIGLTGVGSWGDTTPTRY